MAEARALTRPRIVWENIKDFLAAHTVSSMGGLLFLLLAIFLLWPIIAVLGKSVFGSDGFTLEYYEDFLAHSFYYRALINSLLLGAIVTPLCLGGAFCIAYMTTRGPLWVRTPLKYIALSPLIAPPYIFAISLIILLGNNGIITNAFNLSWSIYGFHGCVIAQVLTYTPLAYIMIGNTLGSLNPNLEDSAANLGASPGKILRSITIPLLAPGFLKGTLIVFSMAMAAFGNLALLQGRTPFLAPNAYSLIIGEGNFNMASVLSTVLIIPCFAIFIGQKYLIKGKSYITIGGKPVATEPKHLDPGILIPMLVVSFIICGFILLTFVVVGIGAFTKLVGIQNAFTLSYILDPTSTRAIINSIKVSLLAGLWGATFAILLAYVVMRDKFRAATVLEPLSLAGFATPGTVLGIGYVLAFNRPPLLLTGTLIILALSSAFKHMAVGVEAGITKLQQLSIEIEEASLNLGAGVVTTLRRIVLPIIFPAFVYGFIYLFLTTMVTLTAMVFLVTPGYPLAAIAIFNAAQWGALGLACAITVKVIIIVAICLSALQLLSKWTGLSATRKGKVA